MAGYYYFTFTNDDPLRSSFKEDEISIEDMRKNFVGNFVHAGDEPHDVARVADIWTEAQAKAYHNA